MAALLAILAAVGWGSSDFAAGTASRRSSAVSVVVLTHLAAVIALLVVAVDLGPAWTSLVQLASPERVGPVQWAWPRLAGSPTPADLGWGLAAGLGGGFGSMLLFRGLGRGSMAVVAPITAAGAATVPVVVGIATGESLTAMAVAGIALAFAAIVLVSLSGDTGGPELTVPEGWVEEFGAGGDPTVPGGLPGPTADGLVFAAPAPDAAQGGVPGAPTTTLLVTAPAPAAVAGRAVVPAMLDELGVTVRSVMAVMMTLFLALVIAAAGIAAGPVADILADDELSPARVAMLCFAVATMAVAAAGLRFARPLFALAAPAIATGAERATPVVRVPAWRRAIAQPGLPEALLSGLGFGLFYVFVSRAGSGAGHWPLVTARGISVVMFTVGALATSTPLLPARGSRRTVAVAGVLDAAAAVLFVLATQAGLLSVGAVLASLYPAVTVVLARTVTRERISGRQLVGLLLALGAVAMLAI